MPRSLSIDGYEAHREFDARLRRFQVLGERSSGTNFVSSLLSRNTELVACDYLGWKHAIPHAQFFARDLLVIVSFRDPFNWVRSMHRKPWHSAAHLRDLPFAEFIRAEWEAVTDEMLLRNDTMNVYRYENRSRLVPLALWNHGVRNLARVLGSRIRPARMSYKMRAATLGLPLQHDRHPVSGHRYRNILEMRSVKAEGFVGLRSRGCNFVFVRYERVKADPEAFLRDVSADFDFAPRREFSPVDEWLGEFIGEETAAATPVELDSDDLCFIVNELSEKVEKTMGYELK